MAIFYKLRHRVNKKNAELSGYYAAVSNKGLISTDEVAEEIQRNCSMKRSDVLAVLAELSEVLKQQIQQSHSVKLDGIGIFRPGISSVLVKNAEDFKSALHIKGLRLNFVGATFKQGKKRLKEVFVGAKIQQEVVPAFTKSPGSEGSGDDGRGGL